MNNELYHYGVKGMKWGVRKYQYVDGTLTPAGRKRYLSTNKFQKTVLSISTPISQMTHAAKTAITGRQYVDGYLDKNTTLARIQTSKDFENFAFYATYKQQDMDKYTGLFGANLTKRANKEASIAENQATNTGSADDISNAQKLRERADSIKVYQLRLEASKKLKVPSDENAADITANLLKDSEFKSNMIASIQDSKEKMKRPSQQILFEQAENALKKDPSQMTNSEKVAVYKAFNLTLVNHNAQEIAAQDTFYNELKKKGYNALLDYNDKDYSSYHAKRPMIVFDTGAVKLQSVTETDPEIVKTLNMKYNIERVVKEPYHNTVGTILQIGHKTVSDCESYVKDKMDKYLGA